MNAFLKYAIFTLSTILAGCFSRAESITVKVNHLAVREKMIKFFRDKYKELNEIDILNSIRVKSEKEKYDIEEKTEKLIENSHATWYSNPKNPYDTFEETTRANNREITITTFNIYRINENETVIKIYKKTFSNKELLNGLIEKPTNAIDLGEAFK